MTIQAAETTARFRALHERGKAFVIANVWDRGSARLLEGLGFEALATSSGAAAGVLGRRDGKLSREEALAHAREIAAATDLPVSADLENGYGDGLDDVVATIEGAIAAGLAGCSIEDYSGNELYSFEHALKRIEAAVATARRLSPDFVLTARTEGFLRGKPDLAETLKRLQAFEAAGADVLMAPGLNDPAQLRQVCGALARPFNYMVAFKGLSLSVAELERCGVRRISLASSLWRAAMGGLLDAAREVKEKGTFGFLERAAATPDLVALMKA